MNRKNFVIVFSVVCFLMVGLICFSSHHVCAGVPVKVENPEKLTEAEQAEKKQQIILFMKSSGSSEIGSMMKARIIPHLMMALSKTKPEFWGSFEKKINPEEFNDMMIALYSKYLSLSELKEINAFYNSVVGQKMGKLFPKISEDAQKLQMEWYNTLLARAQKEINLSTKPTAEKTSHSK